MIGIVDYRAGNLTSVARALRYLGEECLITGNPETLAGCSHLIFPGVGAAGEAMAVLRAKRLNYWIRKWFEEGVPILGICLGTQVVFAYSEENDTPCLGIVPGEVKRFSDMVGDDGRLLKIPHMGWNRVHYTREHPVFVDLPQEAEYYFVHSYYPEPAAGEWGIGRTTYGITFCSAVAKRNLVAVQFHPEKSGRPGLKILANFCRWGGEDAE